MNSWINTGGVFYHSLILLFGCLLVWLALHLYSSKLKTQSFSRASMVSILMIALLFSLPIPSMQTIAAASPAEFEVAGKEGKILAPNLLKREAYLIDWINGNTKSSQKDIDKSIQNVDLVIDEELLNKLFQLPFDVPEHFYKTTPNGMSDPHALMKTLARWNLQSDEDVTKGKRIMGIGEVSSSGTILMVDDIEAYTKAALKSDPDVFIVPVSAYDEVKKLAPSLIVVPVSHFEGLLYFLSQPVDFWSMNFALFCH